MLKSRWIALATIGVFVLLVAGFAASRAGLVGTASIVARADAGDGPEQPIAFPHDLHAGKNQIPCMYCHYSADRSVDAGIPPLQVCAGCHIAANNALFRADSTGIKKLVNYWKQQKPIPWKRVYRIPDHAHFPHMRHVNAGVQCQECHGPVQEMPVVYQYSSLHMGWCINCHRQRQVRTDCSVCHY